MPKRSLAIAVAAVLVLLVVQATGDYQEAVRTAMQHHVAFHLMQWLIFFGTQLAGRLADGGIVWLLLSATAVKPEAQATANDFQEQAK